MLFDPSIVVAMLLLASSGLGVPVGVPPLPPDPVMAQIAPEDCLYYTTWSGSAQADPASGNATERLFADPDWLDFSKRLEERIQGSLNRLEVEQGGNDIVVPRLAWLACRAVSRQPAALYLANLRAGAPQAGPQFDLGTIVKLGEYEAEAQREMESLAELAAEVVNTVEIEGQEFWQVEATGFAPTFAWGIHDHYFFFCIGEGVLESMLQRIGKQPPQWYADTQQLMPIQRRSTLTYARLGDAMRIVQELSDDPKLADLQESLGLEDLTTYHAVSGLDEQGFRNSALVRTEGDPWKVLGLAGEQRLEPAELRHLPATAMMAIGGKMQPDQMVPRLLMLSDVFGMEGRALVRYLEVLLGISVDNELPKVLGDSWTVWTAPESGGPITGWIVGVEAQPDLLAPVLQRVADQLPNADDTEPRVRVTEYRDQQIYSLIVPEESFMMTPSWCLVDDQLLLAAFPQTIKGFLRRQGDALVDEEVMESVVGKEQGAAQLFHYQNGAGLVETIYPWLQIFSRVWFGSMQWEGIDIDQSMLPPVGLFTDHLQPGTASLQIVPGGIRYESRQTWPSGGMDAILPIATAALAPVVRQTQVQNERAQAQNNLRQVIIAMHNYHDVYKALPAAYNSDEDGKPLLSWRVHLLPYLDHNDLYEEFNLDEPWNSPHNRKLIARMPNVFRPPGSTADPGKTNYLGIGGEQGVILPPAADAGGNNRPVRIRFADITDGTSNTIALVESSDELAVIWTKPGDFKPEPDRPFQGLRGLRPGGVLAAMCDGSVRVVSDAGDAATLWAMLTRAGGEVPDER